MHNLKKHIVLLILIASLYGKVAGQSVPDSVIRQYKSAKTDKDRFLVFDNYLNKLRADTFFFKNAAVLLDYFKSIKDRRSQDFVQLNINDQLSKTGNYATSIASSLEIANRFEEQRDKTGIMMAYRQLSNGYFYAGDKEKDLLYEKKALVLATELNDTLILCSITNEISTSYSQQNMADSALRYGRLSVSYARKSGVANLLGTSGLLATLSEAFIAAKQYDSAIIYARESLSNNLLPQDLSMTWTYNDMAQIFLATQQYDSSNYYAHKAIDIATTLGFKDQLQRGYEYLSQSFHQILKPDSAYKYLQLAVSIKDSLYSSSKTKQVEGILAREQSRLSEMEKEKNDFQNKIRFYSLIGGLVILGIIAFILYKNNRQKQKANSTLQTQKEKVETTLLELKSTQQQLIQSEKMASLGELTAGIAHEIQNPLNFVNNFSEVNTELIDELQQELKAGKIDDAIAISNDIKDNEQKINHHGKRADAIVKGMLQHSQSSSGKKEPTDINKLADEYLRLAYHGLRAKDKSFNATLQTDFDETIGNINIIPQDIGRVILNLITNAFYVVDEKKKSGIEKYEPTVSISTKKTNNNVAIKVADNGNGIPKNILDKIFQPFFTTKPTGQGTGLGLSLSYDIVKAHGGVLKVETKEGEGTEFIIQLSN